MKKVVYLEIKSNCFLVKEQSLMPWCDIWMEKFAQIYHFCTFYIFLFFCFHCICAPFCLCLCMLLMCKIKRCIYHTRSQSGQDIWRSHSTGQTEGFQAAIKCLFWNIWQRIWDICSCRESFVLPEDKKHWFRR